jgi:hypothetical protein
MRLEIHEIATGTFARIGRRRPKKMVETDFEQIRRRCIARNVAT